MEQYELELIAKYGDKDEELKRLWEQHLEYEKQVERLENKPYLTPEDDIELKKIKKLKLAGKTKIQAILEKYRKMEEGQE